MRENRDKIQIEVLKVISGSAEGKFAIVALVFIAVMVIAAFLVSR